MGLDVLIYAETLPTEVELEQAEEFFKARSHLYDTWGIFDNALVVNDAEWLVNGPRVEINTLARYYGSGYERGDWPAIYGAIRVLQAAFPDATVYYGSDASDLGQKCTDEFLSSIWEHFLGPNGNDYRERINNA